jgi:hypothetical protein
VEDSVFNHLSDVERQIKSMVADLHRSEAEVKVLRNKVDDLEAALELASSTAKARYHHWSYQTYLFFRWYFLIRFKSELCHGIRGYWLEVRTPLLSVVLRHNARSPVSTTLEDFYGIFWLPDLPIEVGKELYKHAYGRAKPKYQITARGLQVEAFREK